FRHDVMVDGVLHDLRAVPEHDQPNPDHLLRFLLAEAGSLSYQQVRSFVAVLIGQLGAPRWCPQLALLLAVHPALVADVPALAEPAWYPADPVAPWVLLALDAAAVSADFEHRTRLVRLRAAVAGAVDLDAGTPPEVLLFHLLSTRQLLNPAEFKVMQAQ